MTHDKKSGHELRHFYIDYLMIIELNHNLEQHIQMNKNQAKYAKQIITKIKCTSPLFSCNKYHRILCVSDYNSTDGSESVTSSCLNSNLVLISNHEQEKNEFPNLKIIRGPSDGRSFVVTIIVIVS